MSTSKSQYRNHVYGCGDYIQISTNTIQRCLVIRLLKCGILICISFAGFLFWEPEPLIPCNQSRVPVKLLGHQHSYKPFDIQFVLPTKCAGVKKA